MTDQPRRVQRPWIWTDRPPTPSTWPAQPGSVTHSPHTATGAQPSPNTGHGWKCRTRCRRNTTAAPTTAPVAPTSPHYAAKTACFCPLDEPCHADVLLELANA